jgi:WS/DGAT/MGAT family acyltransferase
LLLREEVLAAPHSSLNTPLGSTRHFTAVGFDFADIREIRTVMGGTVNDVVLALCTGALRELLLSRGEEPPGHGLRAQVPVNIRTAEHEHALGNELTSLFVELPVAEPDAIARYERIVEQSAAIKRSSQTSGGKGLVEVSELLPPVVGATLGRMLFGGTRMFNLTITNVPGPPERRYALGAPLREVLPLVPLFPGHSVGIAAVSYAGRLVFGLHADRAGAPDLGTLAEGLRHAYSEIRPSVHRPAVRHPLERPLSRR